MTHSQIRLSVHLVKLACRVLLKCILHELREGSLRSRGGLSLLLRFLSLSFWREVHLLSTKRSKYLLVDKARLGLSSQRVSLLYRLMSLLFTAWQWIFELLELFKPVIIESVSLVPLVVGRISDRNVAILGWHLFLILRSNRLHILWHEVLMDSLRKVILSLLLLHSACESSETIWHRSVLAK